MANESSLAMDGLHSILSAVHEVPNLGAFSRHVFQSQKRESKRRNEHPSTLSQPLWKNIKVFFFFPCGHFGPLAQLPCREMTEHDLKDGMRTNWGYNFDTVCNKFTTSIKYFTLGHFCTIPPNTNTFLVWCSYGLRTGKWAALEFVCSGELNRARCLHNRPLLYCGKSLTWSSAWLADWEAWVWVWAWACAYACVHWEIAWRRLPCSTSPAPCTCQWNKSQQLQ